MASADIGNYQNRRLEGMLNIPVIDDRLDIRIAGEWTKRDGYTFNETTGQPVDGRDLWSSRVTVGWKPVEKLQTYLIWEHFSEDDDRVRSAKQLCKKDPGLTSVDGLDITTLANGSGSTAPPGFFAKYAQTWLSQGCLPTSLYSADAFETPNGQTIPFVGAGEFFFAGNSSSSHILEPIDPYASQTQSRNLRVIQSELNPSYRAKNDTLEFNADFVVTPTLTLTSQTGYNKDFLYSTEDFNRFDTAPGLFGEGLGGFDGLPSPVQNGIYCDPQLGCSNAMVGEDLSQERAWQFSQEVRLASNFSGPLNFSAGANYIHYQTVEDYYVFFNLISATEQAINGGGPGPAGYSLCREPFSPGVTIQPVPFYIDFDNVKSEFPSNFACSQSVPAVGTYIDPNPIDQLDGQGHNYFRSENPYRLNSVAGFGEAYYQVTPDVKLIGGLRWTDDSKRFVDIPSQVFLLGGGYPVAGIVNQEWKEWTGRFVADWTPQLDFTDASLFYASYSRGYKGGGANPPGPSIDILARIFRHASANVCARIRQCIRTGNEKYLLDGGMTLNGDVFYYDYKGYQISQIVDRTSINLNINAKIKARSWRRHGNLCRACGSILRADWKTPIDKGQSAIDLMDRTAEIPIGWSLDHSLRIHRTVSCRPMVRQILPGSLTDLFAAPGACDCLHSLVASISLFWHGRLSWTSPPLASILVRRPMAAKVLRKI